MNITVGGWWVFIYGILAMALLLGGFAWLFDRRADGENPIFAVVPILLSFVFIYNCFFAATHFRVPINQKALLIDTINQTSIGFREPGVQSKPLIGVKVINWPSNTQYQLKVEMGPELESASTKSGAPVYVSTTVYFDLSEVAIEEIFAAVNGDWDVFLERSFKPGLLSAAREVTQNYLTPELTTFRARWQVDFETFVASYLETSEKGFGIKLVPGRTIMSWDFVSSSDAQAFDDANRASYLVTQRQNEMAALEIEAEMASIRADMMVLAVDGTITGLTKLSEFLAAQPPELRPYLIAYLQTQVDLEYLRLIAQLQPDVFFPPSGQTVIPTFSTGSASNP